MENLLIAARAVHDASTIALAGACAFLCLVAAPAFRHAGIDPAAAPSLRRRFARLCWASLALALVSGAAWLAATASTMSGEPLTALWSQGILLTVLTRTQFGQIWLFRLVLAALLGCCLLVRRRRHDRTDDAVTWIALALAAALLATLAWAGHGAATPGLPGALHLAADILHLLAAGLWLGTLIPLALLLAEARRNGDAGWTAVARAATRRFSAMAVASVAVLVAAGLVNTWFLAGTVPALLGTGYGRLLLAKIAIFAAMLLIAAVNLFRLTPRLAKGAMTIALTLGQLRRNAYVEAGCGLAVIAIVGVLGTLPPGLHTEPGWPLPFRIDTAVLSRPAEMFVALVAALGSICAATAVGFAAAGRYRRAAVPAAGLVLGLAVAWLPLRAAVEPAYPTTYHAPTEPYAAPSVTRGAPLYAENCALCHGAGPADLTAAHLLAHPPGDLFWWITNGRANGAMPGFAAVIGPERRWDLVNFLRARAAGVQSRRLEPTITAAAALPVPDFAFERDGRQQTLTGLLKRGPVLLILFSPPPPAARLAQLAAARRRLAAAGLSVIAVDLGEPPAAETALPFVSEAAADVASTLRLFAPPGRSRASELLLDRAGNARARWANDRPGGLADAEALAAAAGRVARFPAAAPRHAGHAH
jgi:putative copper resistance protein D